MKTLKNSIECIIKTRQGTVSNSPKNFVQLHLEDLARYVSIGAHTRHDAMLKTWGWRIL